MKQFLRFFFQSNTLDNFMPRKLVFTVGIISYPFLLTLILCTVPCLQISIFLTHLSNYSSDHLALLVFDSLIKYLQCWTNLKLSTEHPTALAERYFAIFPGEIEPVWQVLSLCKLYVFNSQTHTSPWQEKTLSSSSKFCSLGSFVVCWASEI